MTLSIKYLIYTFHEIFVHIFFFLVCCALILLLNIPTRQSWRILMIAVEVYIVFPYIFPFRPP